MKHSRILSLILVAAFPAFAHAHLSWDRTEADLFPKLGDETAVGHFKYQNTGNRTILIQDLSTSCGCTAASTTNNRVRPGEKGEITAVFQLGNRSGLQEKTIVVTTDDVANPPTQLKLRVAIPTIIDFRPAFLFWQADETPTPKTITVKVGTGVSLKSFDVSSSDANFMVKVEQPSKGEYQIYVEPRQTNQDSIAALVIKPTLEDGTFRLFTATARVMPKPSAPWKLREKEVRHDQSAASRRHKLWQLRKCNDTRLALGQAA